MAYTTGHEPDEQWRSKRRHGKVPVLGRAKAAGNMACSTINSDNSLWFSLYSWGDRFVNLLFVGQPSKKVMVNATFGYSFLILITVLLSNHCVRFFVRFFFRSGSCNWSDLKCLERRKYMFKIYVFIKISSSSK